MTDYMHEEILSFWYLPIPLCQCHTNTVNVAWKEHNPTGDCMSYVLAASQHGFQFIVQLSLHNDVGTFDGAMVK